MTEPTNIDPGDPGTGADGNGGGAPGQGRAPHYKDLAEADAAAREFQSRYDKAQARLEAYEKSFGRFKALGGPAEIAKFVGEAYEIVQRPDFRDYLHGKLVPKAGDVDDDSDDDEFLSDAEKEVRSLRGELRAKEQREAGDRGAVNSELAELRFERAEAELVRELGDLWSSRRDGVLDQVRRLTANGTANSVKAITPGFLLKAWASSFDTISEFEEHVTKWVLGREASKRATLGARTTSGPHTESPGAPASATARSFKEAWELGQRDRENLRVGRPA